MVFQQDAIEALSEDCGDVAPQGEAARQFVGRETRLAADLARLVEEVRVGNLVDQAERHQRDRMGMHDSVNIAAFAVDLLVEGQFGGRAMRPIIVPSARTQTMSSRRRLPLSRRAGVIQISPFSSRMERLPPDVVVMR